METKLASWVRDTDDGRTADKILRACVHCGFCLATCPTYQILGDELDGPRGRIYQIKQVLEGVTPTRETQVHLDRCLTCRSCETTCPSGVQYGRLVDIGRAVVDERVQRPPGERFYRWLLREGVSRPKLFGTLYRLGRTVSWALPKSLRDKLGVDRPQGAWPNRTHARKVLLLKGCVQPAMSPSIDAATARVLDAVGVQAVVPVDAGCCGAIRQHLDDHSGARDQFRRNIDAWWPYIASGEVEAIVSNASGCGAMIADYEHQLRNDPAYAEKARRIVEMTRDVAEFLPGAITELAAAAGANRAATAAPSATVGPSAATTPSATVGPSAATTPGATVGPSAPTNPRATAGPGAPATPGATAPGTVPTRPRVAFHPPCTLQHGLKIRGVVEKLLVAMGAELVPVADSHLCCGSAGTYSLLQTELAGTLRTRKLESLLQQQPEVILSANIGCVSHLQGATAVPVRHWVEWVDEVLRSHTGGGLRSEKV